MVRAQRYLEIIEEQQLVQNAAVTGEHLRRGLEGLAAWRPDVLSNARGRGLMCSIDFRDTATRDTVQDKAYELGVLILPCGAVSLRFRSPLDITVAEVDEGLAILKRAVEQVVKPA
jgi:L-lysine 6-transaminase